MLLVVAIERVSTMQLFVREVTVWLKCVPTDGCGVEPYLFLHRLHLHDNVGWSHISDGWTVHILSHWTTWGITTFRPLLVSSLGIGTFLVLLLSAVTRVLLV